MWLSNSVPVEPAPTLECVDLMVGSSSCFQLLLAAVCQYRARETLVKAQKSLPAPPETPWTSWPLLCSILSLVGI